MLSLGNVKYVLNILNISKLRIQYLWDNLAFVI